MRSGGLAEDYWYRRMVSIRGVHCRIDGRRLRVNLVRVSLRADVMMVGVGGALVDVQHRRLGIDAD